jgi:hypothetical protein
MRYSIIFILTSVLMGGCNYETAKVDGTISGETLPSSVVVVKSVNSEFLGSATANENGTYSIKLNKVIPQAVFIESSGGEYYEVGDEFPTRLDESVKRHTHINYINGKVNNANFNYLTNLSAGLTEYYLNSGASLENALIDAAAVMDAWVGINPSTTSVFKGVDGGITQEDFVSNIDGVVLAFMEKGLSFLALETNRLNDIEGYGGIKSHEIITASYEDIKYEGILNGVTSTRTNASGGVVMGTDFLRHQHALSIAKFLYSDQNKSGLEPIEVAQRLSRMNEAPSDIFGASVAINIPEDVPYLSVVGVTDNTEVSRNVLIGIDSFDYEGIRSISLSFDENIVEIDPFTRNYVLDTSSYKNEDYNVQITAENYLGQKTVISLDLTVMNTLTDVGDVNPPADQLIGGLYTFNTQIPDTYGLRSVRFLIDDAEVFETDDVTSSVSFEYDTAQLTDGMHNFRVDLINNADNISYKTIEFESDNSKPIISWGAPNNPILDLQQNFTASISDDQLLKSVKFINNGTVLTDYTDAEDQAVFNVDFTIDVRSIYEGTHVMSFEAVSASGILEREEREFLVDWENPYVNIITPSGINLYDTQVFTFQADDSNGLSEGNTIMVSVQGQPPFMIDSKSREFVLTNTDKKREELLLEVTVEDIVGRTSKDAILVKYNALSLGNASRTESGERVTYTFAVQGLSNQFYTVDLQTISPTTQSVLDDSQFSTTTTYSNGVGTYSFSYTKFSEFGCDGRSMDYSLTVRHRGMNTDLRVLSTNADDHILGENC